MVIPLPVPHPAQIAVTIYNRDSDDPISLDSDVCQSLLRCIEEHHASPDDSGKYTPANDNFIFRVLLLHGLILIL